MMLAIMAVCVLLAFVAFTWAAWRLFQWSRRRPHHRSTLGLILAALLAVLCVGMILFRWSFSYAKTVNGVGTRIHVELGWLFLLPLGLAVAAMIFWIKARLNRPNPLSPPAASAQPPVLSGGASLAAGPAAPPNAGHLP